MAATKPRRTKLATTSTRAIAANAAPWDPTRTLPGLPGGTAYKDAAPAYRGGAFNVAFRLSSGNREIVKERRAAVINAREVDRNNPMIRAGITKRATDMVGKNLRLQSIPNHEALGLSEEWSEKFAARFENLFSLWGDDPRKLNDAERHSQFGAQMFEVARNLYGADGEAALVIRRSKERQKLYRARLATFVEVLDPDRISNPDGKADTEALCQGRVLDRWGAYKGFHCETRHPSDANGVRKWEYVPRETSRGRPVGVHWFPRYRAGAQRAMPAIIGSLRANRMFDTFDDKQLEAAMKQAFMSIVIKTDGTTAETLAKIQGAPTGAAQEAAFASMMNARFELYEDFNAEGQAMPVMLPGDSVDIQSTNMAGLNTDSFRFAFDRKFAANLGLSYARYSNDYSKTSFASIRAEFIDAWRLTMADRYEFCSSVPSLIALAVLEDEWLNGSFDDIMPDDAPYFYDHLTEYAQCEFRGPAMGWVDPVKDVTASGQRVAQGQSSPQQEAASAGGDFYDNIDATARAQKYAMRKLGYNIDFANKGAAVEEEPDEDPEDAARRSEETREPGSPSAPAPSPAPEPAPEPEE